MTVKATAVAHPAATKLVCSEQTLARPGIDTLYGKEILGRQRSVVRSSMQQTTFEWTMTNANGQPLDLTNCGATVASSVSAESSSAGDETPIPTVQLRLREVMTPYCGVDNTGTWILPGEIVEETTGRVTATLDVECGPTLPGIYWAEFGVLNRDGEVMFTNKFKVLLERSLFGKHPTEGPPTLDDIRMHMRDSDPVESMLLANVEFSDAEIMQAIERPVRCWNETPPPVANTFNTQNFPNDFHWMEGIVGCLLQTAQFHFARNQLAYQAGGMAVDDLNRLKDYTMMGDKRWANYKEFVMRKKAEINVARGWGNYGSIYRTWG